MTDPRANHHKLTLGSPRDLAGVRGLLHELLRGYPERRVADALLIADEVATDALRDGLAPRTLTIELRGEEGVIRIESDSVEPKAGGGRELSESDALGRLLLESLTKAWGVHRSEERRRVWATVSLGTVCRASG